MNNPPQRSRFLQIDDCLAKQLKSNFDCPVYILDECGIRTRFSEFQSAVHAEYENSAVAVSYKTNPTRGILKLLHDDGAFAEIVSSDEYAIARSLGVPTEKIVFNGPCKSDDDLATAISGSSFINCDHLDEVDRIEAIAKRLGLTAHIGIRLRFASEDSWERFGFQCDDTGASQAHAIARQIVGSDNLKLAGIHSHIGTNVRDNLKFEILGKQLASFAQFLIEELKLELAWIDVGGGLAGIAPLATETRPVPHHLPSVTDYARSMVKPLHPILNRLRKRPVLLFEPGRTLFNAFGALLVSVVGRRPTDSEGFEGVILDAGVTSLTFADKYDHPVHICRPGTKTKRIRFFGPTCMAQDKVRSLGLMPEFEPGDLLLFYGTGAYSMAMACSFTHFRLGVVGWAANRDFHWLRHPETIAHSAKLDTV